MIGLHTQEPFLLRDPVFPVEAFGLPLLRGLRIQQLGDPAGHLRQVDGVELVCVRDQQLLRPDHVIDPERECRSTLTTACTCVNAMTPSRNACPINGNRRGG